MKLILHNKDTLPQFRETALKYIGFNELAPEAQAAVVVVGCATLLNQAETESVSIRSPIVSQGFAYSPQFGGLVIYST